MRAKRSLNQSMSGGTLRKFADNFTSRCAPPATRRRTRSYIAMSARRNL